MAKRFTDTDKWKRPWFRSLPLEYRLLWIYICDTCDIAGIWYVDLGLASYLIGVKLDPETAKTHFQKQVTEMDEGSRWFINDFIVFQYGKLVPNNNLHRSIIATLKLRGLTKIYKGLVSPRPGAKVKDKDKDKDKEREKDKDKDVLLLARFEEIWAKYPSKDGKKDALKHFRATVKRDEDWTAIQQALTNYLAHLRAEAWKSPKNGATWFFNWEDWIENKGPTPIAQTPRLPVIKPGTDPWATPESERVSAEDIAKSKGAAQ